MRRASTGAPFFFPRKKSGRKLGAVGAHARLRFVNASRKRITKPAGVDDFLPKFYLGGSVRWHLPLLYDLVETNKPRLIVTVGFDEGEAHFTFCQAALEGKLKCRCVAIRRGEAGEKEDDVWQKGKAYGEFYAEIGRFLTGSPIDLAENFAQQDVDLLLIDDCDSGSTIEQELAAWKSNLAPDALVLVHGIALERTDSPAAAWSRFVLRRPHLEFCEGTGLGIAAMANSTARKRYFAQLNQSSAIYSVAAAKIDAQVRAARSARENTALEMRQIWLESVLADRWKAQEIMDHQAREVKELKGKLEPLQRDRAKAQEIMDTQAGQLRQQAATVTEMYAQVRDLRTQIKEQKKILKAAKEACRKKGRCFQVRTEPKVERSLAEKSAREWRRFLRRLGFLPPAETKTKPPKTTPALIADPEARYAAWIREHEPNALGLEAQRSRWQELVVQPKISLLVPVHDTSAQFLGAMLTSVAAQTYGNWELCIAEAASTDGEMLQVLKSWETREPRFRIERLGQNLGISDNTNVALRMAQGDFIACIDHDDLLAPFALYELARAVNEFPHADIFYADEDRWSPEEKRHSPFFKPEWSPALLQSFMYLGHLTAYRRDLVERIGGFRRQFDLSQDYDFALRATEVARDIRHIPSVLYHWREHRQSGSMGGKPDARKTNLAALEDAMQRRNLPAEIIEYPMANRARLKIATWPPVSIVIPTDSLEHAQICLANIPKATNYPDFEIVLVANSALIARLNQGGENSRMRFIAYDKPFNFSDKCNLGADAASGERLIFFNDDVEPLQADWIQNLIEPLENAEVGAVAPKMLYVTGKIQHAGLVTGVRGLIGTAFHQRAADSTEHFNLAQALRDVSALSAACLAMRRADFVRLGGFDATNTPIAHSDLDLCFKVREAGLRCVYTPFASLQHAGHASQAAEKKKRTLRPRDKASIYLLKRWAGYTTRDPYFPENMRDWLFLDSPTPIQMSGGNDPKCGNATRDVLFVSHDLSSSGAPILLFHLVKWCKEHGIFPVVIAPEGGALRERFREEAIVTIVDPLVATGHESFRRFLRDFDCVVANTIRAWPAVRAAHEEAVPVMWWLHETLVGDHFLRKDQNLRASIPLADFIFTPAERTSAVYRPFTNRPIRRLRSGIPDIAMATERRSMNVDRLRFVLLGSLEPRKGQDIFVEALQQLPPDLQSRAEFKIVGRVMASEFAAKVSAAAQGMKGLSIDSEVSHAEALEVLRQSDVLVCASRDEAMPMTMIEAMSLGKAIISTDVGGIAEVIVDGENGLLVQAENVRELAGAIAGLIERPKLVLELGKRARATYESNFTMDRFGAQFLDLLATTLSQSKAGPQAATDP